ncbi:hypothetical protein AB0L53_48305 [Nonomuraea sp. NPDC052129]|uniref:hypothetical protein n=1 Tax=Nonomuraea sp. NPDC052129 TaxID=3154651 RepID=UPI003437DC6C
MQGTKKYRETYELVYRREAAKPNEIWQADHTELDIWVIDDNNSPARPWLTVIEDDHSRAIAGYAVNLEAPSALSAVNGRARRFYASLGGVLAGEVPPDEVFYSWPEIAAVL